MTSPLRSTIPAGATSASGSDRDLVLAGLRSNPKTLPPKLLYDEVGARLFERICTLDEYYLTRAECEILETHASDIADLAGARVALIEYGSGAGKKVRTLLDALDAPAAYLPIDIAREQLLLVAEQRRREYPDLHVRPVYADYTQRIRLPEIPGAARKVAFFPGSTIGNFHPAEATAFLRRIRATIGPDGALILGMDRLKDERILHAAYNDREGITEAFNLNLLARLNRDLAADFDLSRFRHRAYLNRAAGRIEMHLESLVDQHVIVAGERISFVRGETIWTESSYKFDEAAMEGLVRGAGFAVESLWTDAESRFWVAMLLPASR